ncbi:hypothetical protein [Mycolicibacterium elephantis]
MTTTIKRWSVVAKTISDTRQLLNVADVREIRFHELSAKRTGNTDSDHTLTMRVFVRVDETEIGVRCRAEVSGKGGDYVADAEAVFELSEAMSIPPDILREFVEKVGVLVVYPYVREAVADSAAKLGRPRPVLKILRGEDVKLLNDEDDESDE